MADKQFLDQLSKRLADDGHLIEAGWVAFRSIYVDGRAPAQILEELHLAYMAGAQHTFTSIIASLDPEMERPELRSFKTNPIAMVAADRGGYIAAVLIVTRAYIVAGCPGELPALASFEAWSRIVRSALVWLGRADPIDTMEAARGEDPILTQLGVVLSTWFEAVGSSERSTGAMIELCKTTNPFGQSLHPDLAAAIFEVADDKRGGASTKRLAKYLSAHRGRIVAGLRISGTTDNHTKQVLWKVSRA